jgi:hypothetical protein
MAIDIDRAERQREAGEKQSLFREVNERIAALNVLRSTWLPIAEWVCECADELCTERIRLTMEEYAALRANPTHFAVVAGDAHVEPAAEVIVEKHDAYWVVEKVGLAAVTAEKLDISH